MMSPMVARYQREAPEPPPELEIPESFGYIHFKSFSYLARGPEDYRQQDALDMPLESWSPAVLSLVAAGCRQILEWRGMEPAKPLTGIGIEGFCRLCDLFHFKVTVQKAQVLGNGLILDAMQIQHVMTGEELTLYNLVQSTP